MAGRLISTLVLIVACQTASADIFKWVDAEGVTHFGSQPPMEQAVKRVELKSGGVKTKDVENPYMRRDHQAKNLQEIDDQGRIITSALTKDLTEISDNGVELNCRKAVNNGQHWAKKMYQASVKNKNEGRISDAKFAKMLSSIRSSQKGMTQQNCEGATGKEVEFYRCLSDDSNHLVACDSLH